jgi:hypothetical protein
LEILNSHKVGSQCNGYDQYIPLSEA